MQERLIELSVGETLQVGEYTVTIVAINGDELCFEIDEDGQDYEDTSTSDEFDVALSN